jgi:hypothetical protein
MCQRFIAVIVCWLAFVPLGQRAQPIHITPADDGVRNTSFREFRDQLIQAAHSGNIKRVLSVTSADVNVTHGRTGLVALRREWQLDRSPTRFLKELETVLKLGGRFHDSSCTFVAPYVWTEFPEKLYDVDYVVAIQDPTPIRSGPGTGEVIASAAPGDLLRSGIGERPWLRVTTSNGVAGYVSEATVRRSNSYRAYFMRIMEEWKMVGFMQGVD